MNKPSSPPPGRQREHQANERTFLAWLRTSISLIGFGFAIARFGLFLQEFEGVNTAATQPFLNSQTLGVSLVAFGITVIVLAAWRYNQVFSQIEQAAYRPSRWTIWLLTGIITALGVMSLPLLTKQRNSTDQKQNAVYRENQFLNDEDTAQRMDSLAYIEPSLKTPTAL